MEYIYERTISADYDLGRPFYHRLGLPAGPD